MPLRRTGTGSGGPVYQVPTIRTQNRCPLSRESTATPHATQHFRPRARSHTRVCRETDVWPRGEQTQVRICTRVPHGDSYKCRAFRDGQGPRDGASERSEAGSLENHTPSGPGDISKVYSDLTFPKAGFILFTHLISFSFWMLGLQSFSRTKMLDFYFLPSLSHRL